jgi:hypothetical protein
MAGDDVRVAGGRDNRLLPEGMRTPLLEQHAKSNAYARAALDGAIAPEQAASMLIGGVEKDLTIVHTHPAVLADARLRIDDHKAYLRSLEELHALVPEIGAPR